MLLLGDIYKTATNCAEHYVMCASRFLGLILPEGSVLD